MRLVLLPVLLLAAGLRVGAAAPAAGTPKIPSPSADMAPRDVLRRMMEPIVNIFTNTPPGTARAFSMRLHLMEATNQPSELRGVPLHVYCQPPDKLFVQFNALGSVTTISRQGQTVWATPASKLAPVLERAQAAKVSREDQEPIATLRLPIPVRLFWLLFRLVKVRDGGEAIYNGQVCRRLEVDSPDKEDKGKFMRVWIRADTFELARVDWCGPNDHAYLAIDEAELVPALPASLFQPDAAAKGDLLNVPVNRFRPFMTLLGKEEEKRQKAMHGGAGS